MLEEASQHDMSKNLAGYRKKRDSSAVAADRLVPFFLVNGHDGCILPLLWQHLSLPCVMDKLVEAVNDLVPAILKDFSGYTIKASGFVILQALDSAVHVAERRDFIEQRDLRQRW